MSPQIYFFSESWSLSVEEWFYLIVPLLLYFLLGSTKFSAKKVTIIVIVSLIALVTFTRWYHAYKFGYSDINNWDVNFRKLVVTRMDSIMYGVLGAFLSLYYPSIWKKHPLKLLLIGFLIFSFDKYYYEPTHGIYLNYFYLTITPIATLMLLPALSQMKIQGGIIVKSITFISVISYSMYLLNLSPVQGYILPIVVDFSSAFFGKQLFQSGYAIYALYWVLTISLSFLLTSFFEQPITSLRDRFTFSAQKLDTAFKAAGESKP
ncbi:acyltransferase [Polynucleobacter sp. JS-Polo-80-F4]|nr:acyltransferase family protein [Polynucleobacter sp. JS-Polo-80-F4]MBU3616751.1 acyltransferase [Polynucleobacter sp. JS-Polo-80-F4]